MNASNKLLIAAALLATGYGVATLLGTPDPPYARQTWHFGDATLADLPDRSPSAPSAGIIGSVRLLPAAAVAVADQASPPAEYEPLVPLTHEADVTPTGGESVACHTSDALPWVAPTPRAKLTDVRPAPLPSDVARVEPPESPPADPQRWQLSAPDVDSPACRLAETSTATPVMPITSVRYDKGRPVQGAAVRATFASPAWGEAQTDVLPGPEQLLDEAAVERVHVVVDGDSLPRLAARYLDDPQRSDDIYRLNREVLSSPDLLPIGAELKIPVRQPAERPPMPSAAAIAPPDATSASGLVPVRRIPASSAPTPQAQLLRPLPAAWQHGARSGGGW